LIQGLKKLPCPPNMQKTIKSKLVLLLKEESLLAVAIGDLPDAAGGVIQFKVTQELYRQNKLE